MYVCMYVRMAWTGLPVCVYVDVCMPVRLPGCMYVCICMCVCVTVYACLGVCVYACMPVCLSLCLYGYVWYVSMLV